MKIAVINFSGNVGKTTVSRHLLLPRIQGAELISVESVNADEGKTTALRGGQFAELQEYLQTVNSAIVDIGASNVDQLLFLMQSYRGSHEDFDCFVVPTVPPLKQQQDTIATLIDLSRLGVPPSRLKILFNMTEPGRPVEQTFYLLLAYLAQHPIAVPNTACSLGANEIYGRIRGIKSDLGTLARDTTDYKSLIAKAKDATEKLALAQKLATRRLASGVVLELDACFGALDLHALSAGASPTETSAEA
ncbi:StbB family protein [Methylibium petroleiphilum]|uniref:Uncharacterized protein n=1 Tax=Methylibium petroleiphilum (strain ATCC BAA-1232 / LMG 22953 / PM1) TaxID=420662 RepID=A2SGE3_METPP|nr:StbB family protein [Methylibium petroleiphilum]ABM94632.1 conserved hypothetical protein [Methylibium petroleiphilum PM1]